MEYIVRHARTRDVPEIRGLIDQNVGSRRLLDKHTVNLYEDILEFTVAESSTDGAVAGCGALHVMWDDLAEIRTVAVDERRRGAGIGHLIVDELLDRARAVGVSRVFVLTFAVSFFARHGFTEISGTPVAPEVYAELLRSYDDGVAEFLDLDRVKPNTLGNTRMLLRLLWVTSDLPAAGSPGRRSRGWLVRRRPARVRVQCLLGAHHQSGPAAVLEVADSGPGLTSDQAAHVFERFYRADPARTIGGNGLGLAIVAALVAAHGGATWVRSQPGAGATFCIALPLSPDAMHDADDDFEPDSEAGEQAPGFTATSNAAN